MKLTRRQFNRFFAALGIGAGPGRDLIAQTSSGEDEKSEERPLNDILEKEKLFCLIYMKGLKIHLDYWTFIK